MQSFKVAISSLSSAWMEEKLRHAFGVFDSNHDGFITADQLHAYLEAMVAIAESVDEGYAFNPTPDALRHAVDACVAVEKSMHAANESGQISLDAFLAWTMGEPASLTWLGTLHRLAATENSTL